MVLLQHYGQNLAHKLCRLSVAFFPWKDHGFGEVIHGVGVLVGDGIEQPSAGGFRVLGVGGLAQVFPMAQAVPLLVFHDALVQGRFAGAVAVQGLLGLFQALGGDAGRIGLPPQKGRSISYV